MKECRKRCGWGFCAAVLVLCCAIEPAVACTGFVAGKKASATGWTIVAHNEDNGGPLVLRHALVPAASPAPMFDEPGRAKIPNVAKTCSFFWSEVKSKKGQPPPGDLFLNENGVLVFSNNGGVQAKWDGVSYALPDEGPASTCTDGGLGHNLRLAVAQRARTAAEGVAIVTNLVSTWGYANRSRMFTIADCNEAWIVEVIQGRRYVARRCPDEEVMAYPNCLTIGRLRAGDVCSPEIKAKGSSFDFSKAYQGPRKWTSPYNFHRMLDLYRLTAGVKLDGLSEYPFSVRPGHVITIPDIKRGLSSHYEGCPYEVKDRHPPKSRSESVCVPICRSSTLESVICEFGASPAETVLYVATGRPCQTPYFRSRPFAGVCPPDTVFGADALQRLRDHAKALR